MLRIAQGTVNVFKKLDKRQTNGARGLCYACHEMLEVLQALNSGVPCAPLNQLRWSTHESFQDNVSKVI